MIDVVDEIRQINKRMNELSQAMVLDPFNDDFFDIFTKKRIELVRTIINKQPRSIRALAQTVERDVKNVFNDLKLLNNFKIIGFKRIGRCKKPVVKRKTIIFKFSKGGKNEKR